MRENFVRGGAPGQRCQTLACAALRKSDRDVEAEYREAGGYAAKKLVEEAG